MLKDFVWIKVDGYLYPPFVVDKRFKGGGKPKIPEQEKVETINKIEETKSEEINRQKRASYLAGGKQSTMLYGLQQQLDQRLKTKLGA